MIRAFAVLGLVEAAVALTAFVVWLYAHGWPAGSGISRRLSVIGGIWRGVHRYRLGPGRQRVRCRSVERPVWTIDLRTNPLLTVAVGVELGLLLVLIYVPPVAHSSPARRIPAHAQPMAKGLVQVAAGVALLYAARRYYRNWGTTKEESEMKLPGDELVGGPVVQATQGVWIDAPASAVWPWLVQMGQDRGGLYSYGTLENLGGLDYHNADRIHPEWQCLASGDVIRLVPKGWMGLRDGIALPVVDVIEQRAIVLRATPADSLQDAVWSFHLIPHWDDRCRLLVRTRTRLHHPGEVLAAELAGPANAFMTRGMLLGVKRGAERNARPETAAPTASGGLHRVV